MLASPPSVEAPSLHPPHWESQAVYSRRRSMTSLWGRMLAVGSLQEGAVRASWHQKFLGLERPTSWALVSQAVSRLRPKSWPGSLGDPVTFPKVGSSWERPSGACLYSCLHPSPCMGRTGRLFQRWKPGGAQIVPSAKSSRGQEGLFLPHTKFSSAEVLVLSAWLRLPCSS